MRRQIENGFKTMSHTIKLIALGADAPSKVSDCVLRLPNTVSPIDVTLDGVERIDLHFPKLTDGRAYSQAYLLRRRRGFTGEIRATGDVLIDQLLLMQRSGFDSAVLRADQDTALALQQLGMFADFYQGDAVRPLPRFRSPLSAP